MNLKLNQSIIENYHNNSQIARVLTEDWVKRNAYCPNCGNTLSEFENNRPVADFLCNEYKEELVLDSSDYLDTEIKKLDNE